MQAISGAENFSAPDRLSQVNERGHYQPPEWNPLFGNDFIVKLQSRFPRRKLVPMGKQRDAHVPVTDDPCPDELEWVISPEALLTLLPRKGGSETRPSQEKEYLVEMSTQPSVPGLDVARRKIE